ncbi:hypothetical protein Poly41_14800 [Novipirellula artificiosorum]|uniref:Uncharacterized protein n=1 Tax=Novipirellula artificiosorum TaxID=2528016 RepID=A0A5C6E003_9BACT|nr:hypothetical protein Poly41_14800 [Novipirellula artificiosorum]
MTKFRSRFMPHLAMSLVAKLDCHRTVFELSLRFWLTIPYLERHTCESRTWCVE